MEEGLGRWARSGVSGCSEGAAELGWLHQGALVPSRLDDFVQLSWLREDPRERMGRRMELRKVSQ